MPHNQKSFHLIEVSILKVMSPEEIVVSSHLRRFVREQDIATLKKFMQFDLLLQDHIDVSFVNVTGIARRPVAHTCSCYPGFRTEFLADLNANVWVMDII